MRSKFYRNSTSSGDDIKTARAQELQLKARLLRKQQEELAEQLQRLNEESESLSATDKKLVQAELSRQVHNSTPFRLAPYTNAFLVSLRHIEKITKGQAKH